MTYGSPTSRSRLDRFYCNQSAVEGIDRKLTCSALAWTPGLSRHRAVNFRRALPRRSAFEGAPCQATLLGIWGGL
eukprot:6867301-Pyramimonas_sp.AAC.1